MYYTLANFNDYNRSKIDPIELLLLCPDKHVNAASINFVMRPLVDDLKILKSSGIDLGLGMPTRGSILCILGDNLGSHLHGWFTANFSTMNYMCRFCTVTRSEFLNNCLSEGFFRSPETYNADVLSLNSQDV